MLPTQPFLLLYFFLTPPSLAVDILTPAKPLADGDILLSASETFALGFFTRPSSAHRYVGIWYHKIPVQTIVWVANRRYPIAGPGGKLSLSVNGSLTIASHNSTVVWSLQVLPASSGIDSSPTAQLLDTGNFVVSESGGGVSSFADFTWQSFDYPTDTLLPGMKIGWDITSALYRNLTSWTSSSNPTPGAYMLSLDTAAYPEAFLYSGSAPVWRSGPWNGIQFSGIPEMQTYNLFSLNYTATNLFSFKFNATKMAAYYSFSILNPTILSKLTINEFGTLQRLVWAGETSTWNVFWFAPKDQCDTMGACGPNGICNSNESPICYCLQGFTPKYPSNWALRDGSGGCVRRTALDCVNNTDGFLTVPGVKLPETSTATVIITLSLDQCRTLCLADCKCTAYSAANISGGGEGTGCVMWTAGLYDLRYLTLGGQDIYIRIASADLGSMTSDKSHNSSPATVGIVFGSVAGAGVFAWFGFYLWRRKQRRKRGMTSMVLLSSQFNFDGAQDKDLEMPLFEFDTLASATDNFSIVNLLGEGGFGHVYKGVLDNGQEIAVKRLSTRSVQGPEAFKNEVCMIVRLQHRNLVRLLGCCIQNEERMLIYECMPNKSLDVSLFDKSKSTLLDWQTRFRIINGVARGLLYLHHDSRFRIIHRDLKASNVLLDKEMHPKISDFGMARIFGGDENEANTRRVVGTYGYMSPEYAMDGVFSVKSDVYSFGVLVLEILSGKKNRGVFGTNSNLSLLGFAWELWKEGNGLQLLDESLSFTYALNEAMRCLKVGLLCVQRMPKDRPIMTSVVLMLGSDGVSMPNPKEPGFVAGARGNFECDSPNSRKDSSSATDGTTITVLEGR